MNMLLCNVSWMKEYEGVTRDDVPRNGGEYVREHGFGHEAINFKPHNGKVYGFVQLRTGTIKIDRLDPSAGEKTHGVLVVWRARSTRGSVIVGWYKNATVFRNLQEPLQGRSFQHGGMTIAPKWIIEANATDSFLVPPHYRFFRVPVSHKGFGSQAFVSFLDSDLAEVAEFKDRLLQYISEVEAGHHPSQKRGKAPQVDQVRKLQIERAAIEAAVRHFSGLGYDVVSVERENVGYDLEATLGRETLLIEVKGTANDGSVTACLSPNEYRKSKSATRQYRICIVTGALGAPTVNDFFWDSEGDVWTDENTGKRLSVSEVIAADVTII
jgi:hypothetical protein